MLLSIEERITHVCFVELTISLRVVLEVHYVRHSCIRVVRWEHVVRLKPLVMSIDWLDRGPCQLKVKVHESFEFLVNMIDGIDDLRRFLCCQHTAMILLSIHATISLESSQCSVLQSTSHTHLFPNILIIRM